jgi:formamidopyrimidine-DNA glycosylase
LSCPRGPAESSTGSSADTIAPVPELPDLAVVVDALHAALAGRPVERATAPGALTLRGTPAELEALTGQRLLRAGRRGKFIRLDLERDRVVVSPMLTGRLQLAAPGAPAPPNTTFVLVLGPRAGGPPVDAAPWTADAAWIAPDDASAEVRYRDPTRMGKVYVLPEGLDREVPGLDRDQGPDMDDPALTLEVWRDRIRRHPGELKALLRNQSFVAGLGNAYSDEILHTARLDPFRRRSSLAPEEIDQLYASARAVVASAIDRLRRTVPPAFEQQDRSSLAVHRRGGQPCPRCGTRISEVSSRGEATSWCRSCQA